MQKKILIALAGIMITTSIASAEVIQTQSPIYTDDLGRSHFLGRGGYSSVRHIQMGEAVNSAVNDVQYKTQKNEVVRQAEEQIEEVKSYRNQEYTKPQNVDFDVTKVIKETEKTPVSNYKSSMSFEKGKMDASLHGGTGGTELPNGVNNSKTMYKDDLGRLHFFGRANQIHE